MRSSVVVGKILGIGVEIHFSLFLIIVFLSWSLATGFLPERFPDWNFVAYWSTGFACALSLFVSVLLHELAHSLVARRLGYRVEGITLFLLGGVSSIASESRRPLDDFAISVVGPLTSFVVAAIIGVFVLVTGGSSPPHVALQYVAIMNLLIGLFNLMPAFPLDGGRVLRSVIWKVTGSFRRSMEISTRSGQVAGLLLIGLGIVQIIQGPILQGIWLALVGWFLHGGASESRRENYFELAMKGTTVGDVMDVSPPMIDPETTVHKAVFDYLIHGASRGLIVSQGQCILGVVSITDVKKVRQEVWHERTVGEVMTMKPLKSLTPDDALHEALSLLGENRIHQAPVLVDDRVVGLLSRAHIIQFLHWKRELHLR